MAEEKQMLKMVPPILVEKFYPTNGLLTNFGVYYDKIFIIKSSHLNQNLYSFLNRQ
jgi:hypothetical protein